jgi:hypothetical protein
MHRGKSDLPSLVCMGRYTAAQGKYFSHERFTVGVNKIAIVHVAFRQESHTSRNSVVHRNSGNAQ